MRREERALLAEYRDVITRLADGLTAGNHALAVEIAGLPDMVRGYEHVKLGNVARLPRADGGAAGAVLPGRRVMEHCESFRVRSINQKLFFRTDPWFHEPVNWLRFRTGYDTITRA